MFAGPGHRESDTGGVVESEPTHQGLGVEGTSFLELPKSRVPPESDQLAVGWFDHGKKIRRVAFLDPLDPARYHEFFPAELAERFQ